ncbi:MAG: DUF3368 domain-containing protein [Phycisphaerae bacterium]
MIVVSDTTPLNYLVLIGEIGILPQLFTEIYAPPAVLAELRRDKTPPPVRAWSSTPPEWLRILAPTTRHPFTARLGAGEADALSLAKEKGIREVLIDERLGRSVAASEGLVPLPTLTILEFAAIRNLLQLDVALRKLQQTTFRAPPDTIAALLQRDAARKQQ